MENKQNLQSKDALGYALIFVGVFIIALSFWNGYNLFSGKLSPARIFDLPGITLNLDSGSINSLPDEFQMGIGNSSITLQGSQELTIPGKVINDPLNLIAHIIFLGLFASLGQKIALVGSDITRVVIVKKLD
ncbi:MAG: hypothetical protein NZM26_04250 [Patescibacteria group bacterium]|nr:hypothetical protein [Patescibacteria group bacterium]